MTVPLKAQENVEQAVDDYKEKSKALDNQFYHELVKVVLSSQVNLTVLKIGQKY